jgi:hypothetical protein
VRRTPTRLIAIVDYALQGKYRQNAAGIEKGTSKFELSSWLVRSIELQVAKAALPQPTIQRWYLGVKYRQLSASQSEWVE